MTINATSQKLVIRTQGRFSVLEAEVRGRYFVYPVYLTADLEALASHPMFWEDPTIDYDTRSVAAIYVPANASGWNTGNEYLTLETLDWSTEAECMGDLLDALQVHLRKAGR